MRRVANRGSLLFAILIIVAVFACDRESERTERLGAAIERRLESARLLAPEATRAFYEARRHHPAWQDPGHAVRALLSASEDGLDPSAYHLAEIEALLVTEETDATHAALDILLTDGLLVLLHHLRAGKVDENGKVRWHAGEKEVGLLARSVSDPAAALEKARPRDPQYAALRDALAAERAAARRGGASEKRMEALLANLERRRWEPREREDTRVEVDVPAFAMTYWEDGEEALTARAIVGTSSSGTPILHDAIEHVVLHPTWAVPRSILEKDLLPKIRLDPDYLARNAFRVFEDGKEVDPAPVEWYAEPEDLPFTVIQDPGPENPLGRVKFVFPNHEAIYLHDTPAGALFDADRRAFSHGCIRIEEPLALASRLTGKSREELQEMLESGKTKWIPLARKVPVHLVYWTAVVEEDELVLREDLYGRDRSLVRALGSAPSRTGGAPLSGAL